MDEAMSDIQKLSAVGFDVRGDTATHPSIAMRFVMVGESGKSVTIYPEKPMSVVVQIRDGDWFVDGKPAQ